MELREFWTQMFTLKTLPHSKVMRTLFGQYMHENACEIADWCLKNDISSCIYTITTVHWNGRTNRQKLASDFPKRLRKVQWYLCKDRDLHISLQTDTTINPFNILKSIDIYSGKHSLKLVRIHKQVDNDTFRLHTTA